MPSRWLDSDARERERETIVIVEDELLQLVNPHLTKHVLDKFTRSGIASHEVDACYLELLKFLFLVSKYPELRGSFIPVTKEIDEFWHEAILQTRYYQELCRTLPSGEFIHHETMPYDGYKENKTKEQIIKEILSWVVLYVTNFGDFRADRVQHWFFVSMVMKVINFDLETLNSYARGASLTAFVAVQGSGVQNTTYA
jgi:hypothetical protein